MTPLRQLPSETATARTACIIWKGAFHEGYPMSGKRRAHRVAFEAARGPIPRGHVVHHECDTKACVNPEHLTTMTPRAHMLLHRSWEHSQAARRERTCCKHGHPLDGVKRKPRLRRYCRTCHAADCKRRREAYRRLEPQLPKSPAMAQALDVDERAPRFVESATDGELELDGGPTDG